MKITLLCNLGVSTGIMQQRLTEEAKKNGVEAQIEAIPVSNVGKAAGSDVYLMGPQISFARAQVEAAAGDAVVYVMEPQEFGLMQADIVFKKVIDLLKQKEGAV